MTVDLSKRELEVLECLLAGWDEGEKGLYGNLSYQDVFDLAEKLSLPKPKKLEEFLRWAESQRSRNA